MESEQNESRRQCAQPIGEVVRMIDEVRHTGKHAQQTDQQNSGERPQ